MKEHEFDPSVDTPDTESLLRLARTLVEDADQAEDLVQDVWVRALSRLREVGDAGAYLRTAVRRGVHRVWRDKDRRERREASASPPREIDGPLGTLETDEFRAIVAGAVESLSEPYRETVRLSFYEELTPSEIAVRSSLPAGTVRSRLKRGLDQLRERLDRRYGRTAWIQGFALVLTRETGVAPTLMRSSRSTTAVGTGGSLASPLLFAAAGLFAVIGVARAFESLGSERSPAKERRPAETSRDDAGGLPGSAGSERRERIAAPSSVPRGAVESIGALGAAVDLDGPRYVLHVVDRDMQPLRGVRISKADFLLDAGTSARHPGATDGEAVAVGDSPIELPLTPKGSPPTPLLVGADGSAWKSVLLDRARSSDDPDAVEVREEWVVLDRGASLRVELTGFAPDPSTHEFQLAIDSESRRPLVRDALDGRGYEFSGLPAGPVVVRAIRIGARRLIDIGEDSYSHHAPPEVLGEVRVELDPERTSVARVHVGTPAAAEEPIAATVAVDLPPNELSSRKVSLRIAPKPEERADTVKVPVALAEDGLVLDPVLEVEVTPGPHEVVVHPVLHYELREFTSAETLRVSVPELARVLVHVDPEIGVQMLLFRRILDEPHAILTSQWRVDPVTNECVATVVPGKYVVLPFNPNVANADSHGALHVRVDAGFQSFDFANAVVPAPSTRFLLRFRAGETQIRVLERPMHVEAVGHGGAMISEYLPGEGLHPLPKISIDPSSFDDLADEILHVDTPGLYRFGAFQIPPYLPVAPRIVEAREGEVVTVEYSLELPPR